MTSQINLSYTESDAYQSEVQQQYTERVKKFTPAQVLGVLSALGIPNPPRVDEIVEADCGNVNATYVTSRLVIKLNQDREAPNYLPNKVVSDILGNKTPVVRTIAYDHFTQTEFEALIMERTPWNTLLRDILDMSEQDREQVFSQVLDVVIDLFGITFPNFWWINMDGIDSYATYSEYLLQEFNNHISTIRAKKLGMSEDIDRIEAYFKKYISIFDAETPVFVHTDLHMGNILHEDDTLTAVIDFDSSLKAPKVRALEPLIGLIHNPQQYTEGTPDFQRFKGRNFHHLLPLLKTKLPEVFSDPQLLRKLNLIGISEGIMWVSQDWSSGWNAETIAKLIREELPKDDLSNTYYARALASQSIIPCTSSPASTPKHPPSPVVSRSFATDTSSRA